MKKLSTAQKRDSYLLKVIVNACKDVTQCYVKDMRSARLAYLNAFHHVMNRGIDGSDIFVHDEYKRHFIKFL